MIGESVTFLRLPDTPTGEDSQGNPTYTRTEVAVENCAVSFGSASDEVGTSGVRAITGGTVYAPTGTVIEPTDLVVIRGEQYAVDGEAAQWSSPFTGAGWGVEVAFKRAV
jgi:hypothetical protein